MSKNYIQTQLLDGTKFVTYAAWELAMRQEAERTLDNILSQIATRETLAPMSLKDKREALRQVHAYIDMFLGDGDGES